MEREEGKTCKARESRRKREEGGEKAGAGREEGSESAVLCGLLCVCHLEWYKL